MVGAGFSDSRVDFRTRCGGTQSKEPIVSRLGPSPTAPLIKSNIDRLFKGLEVVVVVIGVVEVVVDEVVETVVFRFRFSPFCHPPKPSKS